MLKSGIVASGSRAISALAVVCLVLALAACSGSSPSSSFSGSGGTTPGNPVGANLTLVSTDPFTAGPGQHATEVEPHMLAVGNTMVAAFQVGRIAPGRQFSSKNDRPLHRLSEEIERERPEKGVRPPMKKKAEKK